MENHRTPSTWTSQEQLIIQRIAEQTSLPIWEHVWSHASSSLLTAALIINEQHYIEHRIVQDATIKNMCWMSFILRAQALLQLNQVVFPYKDKLAGLILEDFADLHE